jgi:NAD(P)-dependent dehydrogenase (short-subunit alcohol dehydrogenase family)
MSGPDSARLAVVTGATNGFGRAAAEALAVEGFDLFLVCRDRARADRAAAEIAARAPRARIALAIADLSRIAEVSRAASEILAAERPIALLLNNAGAVFAFRRETPDGLEETFALNHLAYFQLTLRLLDRLRASAPARVVNVASDAYSFARGRFDFEDYGAERRYRPLRQYGLSKLANILFTHELARRLAGSGVEAVAWSPRGLTATRFAYGAHWLAPPVMRLLGAFATRTEDAVQGLVALCLRDLANNMNGRFFCGERMVDVRPCNDEDARRLWDLSLGLVGIGGG